VCCACAHVRPDSVGPGHELRRITSIYDFDQLIGTVRRFGRHTEYLDLSPPPAPDDIIAFRSSIGVALGINAPHDGHWPVKQVGGYPSPFCSLQTFVKEEDLVDAVVDILILGSNGDRSKLVEGFPGQDNAFKRAYRCFEKSFAGDIGSSAASRSTRAAANIVAQRIVGDGLVNNGVAYPQFNLRAGFPAERILSDWVFGDQSTGNGARIASDMGMTQPARSVLVMVGGQGRRTPWHIDWTSAVNVGFVVKRNAAGEDSSPQSNIIATWYFVHPSKIDVVDQWLRDEGTTAGLACGVTGLRALPPLNERRWKKLAAKVNEGCPVVALHAFKVDQLSGMAIIFPPGWLHYVATHLPSVKFAWDVYDLCVMDQYVVVWRDLIARFMAADDLPEDYARVGDFVVNSLCKCLR
jgi:hypothetical protein